MLLELGLKTSETNNAEVVPTHVTSEQVQTSSSSISITRTPMCIEDDLNWKIMQDACIQKQIRRRSTVLMIETQQGVSWHPLRCFLRSEHPLDWRNVGVDAESQRLLIDLPESAVFLLVCDPDRVLQIRVVFHDSRLLRGESDDLSWPKFL